MLQPDWDYTLRIFAPPNRGGELLLETTHRGEASRDIELAVCRERMKRGEVSHVEVIAHVPPYGITTITE